MHNIKSYKSDYNLDILGQISWWLNLAGNPLEKQTFYDATVHPVEMSSCEDNMTLQRSYVHVIIKMSLWKSGAIFNDQWGNNCQVGMSACILPTYYFHDSARPLQINSAGNLFHDHLRDTHPARTMPVLWLTHNAYLIFFHE